MISLLEVEMIPSRLLASFLVVSLTFFGGCGSDAHSPSSSGPDTDAETAPGDAGAPLDDRDGSAAPLDAGDAEIGTGTDGGTDTDGGSIRRSAGCGAAESAKSGRFQIDVGGVAREYILDVPESYDTNHAYTLTFGWHWRGGSAADVAQGAWASDGPYYGLKELTNQRMIFVAPQGLDAGWANPNGRDIAFARALVEHLEENLCIDEDRVFSTGFSFGGMFSNAIGCDMADVFRAVAPMSASLWSGCAPGTRPIAYWSAHGTNDDVVDIVHGRAARDEFLARNGCSDESTSVPPEACVQYTECTQGRPVVWCEWSGGHSPPPFAPMAIKEFFSSF